MTLVDTAKAHETLSELLNVPVVDLAVRILTRHPNRQITTNTRLRFQRSPLNFLKLQLTRAMPAERRFVDAEYPIMDALRLQLDIYPGQPLRPWPTPVEPTQFLERQPILNACYNLPTFVPEEMIEDLWSTTDQEFWIGVSFILIIVARTLRIELPTNLLKRQ